MIHDQSSVINYQASIFVSTFWRARVPGIPGARVPGIPGAHIPGVPGTRAPGAPEGSPMTIQEYHAVDYTR